MFENFLGLYVSRDEFLNWRTFPAVPTDTFNDNTCCLCWEPYDNTTHAGMLFLPCNHVMGRDCLAELVKSPGGHLCPICRCQLFDPPFAVKEKVGQLLYACGVFFAVLMVMFMAVAATTLLCDAVIWIELMMDERGLRGTLETLR